MSTEAVQSSVAENRLRLLTVCGLGTTQMIGWGTIFSPLAIFGTEIGNDLGISREAVFGGITVMLLVSALIAPRIGKLIDRTGARRIMMAGSIMASIAMVAMWMAQGLASYLFFWFLAGLAMPLMLSNAALPGLVRVIGPNARRAITGLMLITGITSTVFLPLNAWLMHVVGWRDSYLVFSLLHLLICLPLHGIVLRPRGRTLVRDPAPGSAAMYDGVLPEASRRRAFVLLATWACAEGLITWGLYMQVIDVLKAMGLSGTAAIGLWSIVGPAQASARIADLVFGGRYSIFAVGLVAASLNVLSFACLIPFGITLTTTALFCILLGTGHGLFAVASNTLPLHLFGSRAYGSYIGLLTVPQNIVNAASPVIFAAAISRIHPAGALWIAGTGATLGLAAVLMLMRVCREEGRARAVM